MNAVMLIDVVKARIAVHPDVLGFEVFANQDGGDPRGMLRVTITNAEMPILPWDEDLTRRVIAVLRPVVPPRGILIRFSFGPTWKYSERRKLPVAQMTREQLDEFSVECDRLLARGEIADGDGWGGYPGWIRHIQDRRRGYDGIYREWTAIDIHDGCVNPAPDLDTGLKLPFES